MRGPIDRWASSRVTLSTASAIDELCLELSERRASGRLFIGFYPALALAMIKSREYRDILETSVIYPDGNGVVWTLRMLGWPCPARMATTDIIWDVLSVAESRRLKVGFYGGRPDVLSQTVKVLKERFPRLDIAIDSHGYTEVDPGDAATWPVDILFVGLGAPKQEIWSHEVLCQGGGYSILTCGGLFDFISGNSARAPKWMQRHGLEWLFRVWQEPRRLFLRYFLGNVAYLVMVFLGRIEFTVWSREGSSSSVYARPSFKGRAWKHVRK